MNILMITKYGIGKMVKVSDFRNMKRGAVGVKCLNTNDKSDRGSSVSDKQRAKK